MRRYDAPKRRRVITAQDLGQLEATHDGVIYLEAQDLVTEEAQDRAGWLGLRFERGNKASPGPEPTLASPGVDTSAAAASVLITGGRILLPGQGLVKADLLLAEGKVQGLGMKLGPAETQFDAAGLVVAPGIFDPHVHLGLFAPLAEEWVTEGRSALLGGVTTTGLFMGGSGSHMSRLDELEQAQGPVDVVPHLVIGDREQLAELDAYVARGVRSFKTYMAGIPGLIEPVDDAFMTDLFSALAPYAPGVVLCIHAENASLIDRAKRLWGEKAQDLESWAVTHPPLAEAEAIQRASMLGEEWGVPTYFVHISSARGILALRTARREHAGRLWGETTSPYLGPAPPDEAAAKMMPPLRSVQDKDALWAALADGTLNSIGTDNVTMTRAEKGLERPFGEVMPGYPMLGVHLALLLEEGYHRRGVELDVIMSAVTRQPAEIFGLYPQKGTLLPGSDADCVVLDLNESRVVTAAQLASRSDFAPHAGLTLRGWPVLTLKNGQVTSLWGQRQEVPGTGRVLLGGERRTEIGPSCV